MAKQLGNKHRHVMALLDKYLDTFKTHDHMQFQNADGERRQGGGKAERMRCKLTKPSVFPAQSEPQY
jgi:hypothetical protein